MSSEVRIGEAVASLTARLEKWGIKDAPAKAQEFVQDMLRAGWRPSAHAVESFPRVPEHLIVTAEQARAYAAAAREGMARAQLRNQEEAG